jgi:hypothetical protein
MKVIEMGCKRNRKIASLSRYLPYGVVTYF